MKGSPGYPYTIARSVAALMTGDCSVKNEPLEKTAVMAQSGRRYTIFRRSFFNGASYDFPAPGAVFEVEFRFKTDPGKSVSLLTLPFFAGFAGLLEKLWMVDESSQDYAGIYFFRSKKDAKVYSESPAQRVVRKLTVPGTYKKSIWDINDHPMKHRNKE